MANFAFREIVIVRSSCDLARNVVAMVQNNRQLIRLFFVLVIGVGLWGGWLTQQWVQLETLTLTPTDADNRNWVDLLALIGEQTIQLFLGLTSGQ
jgi:hypothetical protein